MTIFHAQQDVRLSPSPSKKSYEDVKKILSHGEGDINIIDIF
jgi:hypothetical protein